MREEASDGDEAQSDVPASAVIAIAAYYYPRLWERL